MLVKRTLSKWNHVPCGASAYLERHGTPRSPGDLAGHNFLRYAYSPYSTEFHFTDRAGNQVPARMTGNLVSSSIVVMRTSAVTGLGLWMCPPFIVSDLLASGELVALLPEYSTPEMEIVALYPHRRQLSAKVRLFLDMLVDQFAEEQRRINAAETQ